MEIYKFIAGGYEFSIKSTSIDKAREILQAYIDKRSLN